MPATVADAYHLLRQALTQPDPVVFIEHKALYQKGDGSTLPAAPWGKAAVRREGKDLVIVTYSKRFCNRSKRRRHSRRRASRRRSSICEPSIRSISTPSPACRASAAPWWSRRRDLTAGVAAELSARISEECFDFLEEAVVRVAGEDIPISVSRRSSVAPCRTRNSSSRPAVWMARRTAPAWAHNNGRGRSAAAAAGETMEEGPIVTWLMEPGTRFSAAKSCSRSKPTRPWSKCRRCKTA